MAKKTFYNLPEDKRLRIITAARAEFAAAGYDLASIQNIIKTAQIPRGSFYQYFEDKKDLFIEILIVLRDEKISHMRPVLDQWRDLPLFDLLAALIHKGIEYAKSAPDAVRIAASISGSRKLDLREIIPLLAVDADGKPVAGTQHFYEQLITHAVEKGEVASSIPVATMTAFIRQNMESLSMQALQMGSMDDYEAYITDVLYIMKNGIIRVP